MKKFQIAPNDIFSLILSSTSAALILGVVGQLLGFVQQVMLARLLGAREFGGYTYILYWTSLTAFLATAGIGTTLNSKLPSFEVAKNWGAFRSVLTWALVLSLGLGMIGAVLLAGGLTLFSEKISPDMFGTLILGCFTVPFISISTAVQSVLIAMQYAVRTFFVEPIGRIVGMLVILSMLILLQVSMNSFFAMSLTIATYFISSGVLLFILIKKLPADVWKARRVALEKNWLFGSIQLFIISLLQLLIRSVDLLFVGYFLGIAPAGIYAVATRLADFAHFPLNAVTIIASPKIAAAHSLNDSFQLKVITYYAHLSIVLQSIPIFLLFVLGGRFILQFFGAEFALSYEPLLILLGAPLASCLFGPVFSVLAMTSNYGKILVGLVAGLVVDIALNLVTIPKWGLVGAAVSTTATAIFVNGLLCVLIRFNLGIPPMLWFGKPNRLLQNP